VALAYFVVVSEFTFVKHDQYPGFPELKKSAEAGCEFCAFVRGSFLADIAW